jgi:hypothetical protein
MSELHPDHLRLLSLARAALLARDNRALWKASIRHAAEEHGAACDALWDEIERQVTVQDGRVPVLEHPAAKHKRMVLQMRSEIVAVVQDALTDALSELADGPRLDIEDDE